MLPATRRPSDEHGVALLLVVMLLAAMAVLLGTLLAGVNASLARRHADWREQVTHALATAGIEHAAASLAEDGAGYSGDENLDMGEGQVSVSVLAADSPGTYVIRSTGTIDVDRPMPRKSVLTAEVRIDGARIVSIRYLQRDDAADPKGRS